MTSNPQLLKLLKGSDITINKTRRNLLCNFVFDKMYLYHYLLAQESLFAVVVYLGCLISVFDTAAHGTYMYTLNFEYFCQSFLLIRANLHTKQAILGAYI